MNEAIQQELDFLKEAIAAYESNQCVTNLSSLVSEMIFLTGTLKIELNEKRNQQ